jgi:hypothetical protein
MIGKACRAWKILTPETHFAKNEKFEVFFNSAK